MKKTYSIMYQSVVIGGIVLLSKWIESLLPFIMPASVIGLVLLFVALCTNVLKLEQVERVGDLLVDNIGLFFVPAGVSVINSLGLLHAHFVLNLLLIFLSTVLLLVATGWMTQLLLRFNPKAVGKTALSYVSKHQHYGKSKKAAHQHVYAK